MAANIDAQAIKLSAGMHAYNICLVWNPLAADMLKARLMNEFGMPNDAFEMLYNDEIQPNERTRWVASSAYPHLDEIFINDIEDKIQRVDDDIETIRSAFENGKLGLLVKFPLNDSRVPAIVEEGDEESELYLSIPQPRCHDFNLHFSQYLNLVASFTYPQLVYDSLAFWDMTASHALLRGYPILTFSPSCLDREDRIGNLRPIDISARVLAGSGINVNWQLADFDRWSPNSDHNILQLYTSQNFRTTPPQGALLQSPAYRHMSPHKERCASSEVMKNRLGPRLWNKFDQTCRVQFGWIGGLAPYLDEHEGRIVVAPGDMLDHPFGIIHPNLFNKQYFKAKLGERFIWTKVKNACRALFGALNQVNEWLNARSTQYQQKSQQIREYLRSEEYADSAEANSNYGLHAYGICNLFRGYKFHFTHNNAKIGDERYKLNLPSMGQEYSKSHTIQGLASPDLTRVHAIGMDYTEHPSHRHMVQFDVPVPSIGALHASNGPAAHPILGIIATVCEEYYRPTLYPFQFRFVITT